MEQPTSTPAVLPGAVSGTPAGASPEGAGPWPQVSATGWPLALSGVNLPMPAPRGVSQDGTAHRMAGLCVPECDEECEACVVRALHSEHRYVFAHKAGVGALEMQPQQQRQRGSQKAGELGSLEGQPLLAYCGGRE